MNRRGFFKLFGAGIAGMALEQAIPLGRVWSFPSTIVVPELTELTVTQSVALQLEKVRHLIPTIYEQEVILLDLIEKHGEPVQLSNRRIRIPWAPGRLPITEHSILRVT